MLLNHLRCVRLLESQLKGTFIKLPLNTRSVVKSWREQDPEEVKKLPVFQYATENTTKTVRVYVWGSVVSGALGHVNFLKSRANRIHQLKTMHKPFRLHFADTHRICDVSCGFGFTVFCGRAKQGDSGHIVFGTGLNSDSQIGYHRAARGNPHLEILAQPVPILLPLVNSSTKAIKAACGRAHTVILTDKEGLFSLGNNAFGQCGRPIVKNEIYEGSTRVNKIEGIDEPVIKIVCGQDHTLFLTETGAVYSSGWGADGQTGLGHYKDQGVPARVQGDIVGEKIIHLSGAADCVLAVSEKGDVFGWGNSEYGQLRAANPDVQQINVSRHLHLPEVGKVISASAGGTICGVVNEKGQVYVWGYGILGKGPEVDHIGAPTLLPEPLFGLNEFNPTTKVNQIECGVSHFAAVTNKGDIYMWGKNRSKCLGLGNITDQYFPFKVSVPAQVLKVSCGVNHTAVLCRAYC